METVEVVALTKLEIYAIIAALNFTKNRTKGISWELRDEEILEKMRNISNNFGVKKA